MLPPEPLDELLPEEPPLDELPLEVPPEELPEELDEELPLPDDELPDEEPEEEPPDELEEELLLLEMPPDEEPPETPLALYISISAICGALLAESIIRLSFFMLTSPRAMIASAPRPLPDASCWPLSCDTSRQFCTAMPTSRITTVLKDCAAPHFTETRSPLADAGCQLLWRLPSRTLP